ETRWHVLIAAIGLGGIYLALPEALVVGPRWLLLAIIGGLGVPAALAHYSRHHVLDTVLGYVVSGVVTLALAASLALLLTSLPKKNEPPALLLRSAAVLWITNVLVFALWYWRLDAGGPHARDKRGHHTAGAFFFPQMMQGSPNEEGARWLPRFL